MTVSKLAVMLACSVHLSFSAIDARAQSALPPPAPASVVSHAEWTAVMEKSVASNRLDTKVHETEVRGGILRVGIVNRTRDETRALIHEALTETYYIVKGAGTLITGGVPEEVRPVSDPPNLGPTPSFFATQVGGDRRRVGPGDIIIIPAGLPHRLIELDGPMSYIIHRFEGKPTP